MKQSVLLSAFILMALFGLGQTTYYWVGGNGATANVSFTSASKWNTALDGSGTTRATADPSDILIVDGNNIGGTTPTTGTVTATCGSNNFGKLILRNNAVLTLVRPTTGNGTITVNGDATTDDDLLINAGCTLISTVADSINTTSGNNLLLSPTATGRIYGTLFLNGGSCRLTASNPAAGGSCFFESGSLCKVNTQLTYYPFGSSSGVANAVVFNSGSKLNYLGGNCIFTTSSSFNPVDFKTGSTFRIETSVPNATVTSSNLFSARRFSHVEVGNNASVTGDFFYNIDNLTIDPGASFFLKTSGASPIAGNIVNNGTFGSATGFTSSNLLMKGITPQTIGGTGTFLPLGAVSVATDADVILNANIVLNGTSNALINGKINFQNYTMSGTGTLQTKAALPITTAVTAATIGSYTVTLDAAAYSATTNTAGVYNGILVSGSGIPANTYIIGTSSSSSTITISNPVNGAVSSVVLSGGIPVLRTSNINGIDGSVGSMGALSFTTSTDYVFDGPTTQPFSLLSLGTMRNVTFNASATTNRSALIDSVLTVNSGILSIRAIDTLRVKNGKDIGGAPFSNAKHIAILNDGVSSGALRIDLMTAAKLFPVGSVQHYLPVTLTPNSSSSLTATVYEGITSNGSLTGAALPSSDLLKVVNAVWRIGRVSGTGDLGVNFGWDAALEGTLFSTQANSRIGVIQNTGTAWGTPFGTGDNAANTASATATSVGYFGIGSVPLMTAFTFNAIAPKTYGDADFNSGVVSLNTAQPINFSSSNPAVATINAAGIIHIVGAGSTNITATQASDGTYLDANETQILVVNKAALVIRADDKSRFVGTANPTLTTTYAGFVYGESASILLTPPTLSTTATVASVAGTYPINVSGAAAANYVINYVNGTMTVFAQQTQVITFNSLPALTYGAADFTPNVSSNNNSIPVSLSSSNAGVATIVNGNMIHITGAGTTTITASQGGDAGHIPAVDVAIVLVVNKAPLTITVLDTMKSEGNPNPAFTIVYSGFVLGENESVLNVMPTISTDANDFSSPGIYTLTPENADAANYSFTYNTGKLTIYPKDNSMPSISVAVNGNLVQVKMFSPEPDLARLIIYDQLGHPVEHKDVYVPKGFTSATMMLRSPSGAYYILTYRGKKHVISKQFLSVK